MVFMALVGMIAVGTLIGASHRMHLKVVDQMVRDIDAISGTAWKMKRVFGSLTAVAGGDRLISNAFSSSPPVRGATANIYRHPLEGFTTVSTSATAVTLSIAGLTLQDCTDFLFRIDGQKWAIVRVNGTATTVLKSNTTSPYAGDITAGLSGLADACNNAGNGRTVYMERRLQ